MVHSGFARKDLRSHVLLAACRSQELAGERTRGAFTVALLKILMDVGIDKLTYATLIDHWMPPLYTRWVQLRPNRSALQKAANA